MNIAAPFVALSLLAQSGASRGAPSLEGACRLVSDIQVHLMLVVMAEGPVDCGDGHGPPIDCDAGESEQQRAIHAQRLALRERQLAVFTRADNACTAWAADRGSAALREAAIAAFREAQAVGTDIPAELQ